MEQHILSNQHSRLWLDSRIFTSTFLKKKEEHTRIAGVIVEKRINSEQEILHFLESELFKQEINMDNSSKDDYLFDELLKQFELPVPYDGHMQYARVFTKPKMFEDFFHKFEEQIMNHKLWLDTKVKEHLVFMQIYFSFFNTLPHPTNSKTVESNRNCFYRNKGREVNVS